MNQSLDLETLDRLSRSEFFDIALALHLKNRPLQELKPLIRAIANICADLIIEINSFQNSQIKGFLGWFDPQLIGQVQDNYLYHLKGRGVGKTFHISSFTGEEIAYTIDRQDDMTVVYDDKLMEKPSGIRLLNYLYFNGSYPSRSQVIGELGRLRSHCNERWSIDNMIVQGNTLHLSEVYDAQMVDYSDNLYEGYKKLVTLRDQNKIRKYYQDKLFAILVGPQEEDQAE